MQVTLPHTVLIQKHRGKLVQIHRFCYAGKNVQTHHSAPKLNYPPTDAKVHSIAGRQKL